MKPTLKSINEFLEHKHLAVVGVSRNEKKFGSVVYKELREKGFRVYAVNPNMDTYMDDPCYKTIDELPESVSAIHFNTKPEITEKLLNEAIKKGIKQIWVQQGAQNDTVLALAEKTDANVIVKRCIFMFVEPVTGPHKFHRLLVKLFGGYPK